MLPVRQWLLAALCVWLAALVQGRGAHAISIRGAQPDLPLVALTCAAFLMGSLPGTGLGFWTGLLAGAAFPSTYGSVFASRIVAGAFAGSFGRSLICDNWIVPPLVVLATTLLAEGVHVLMAPGLAAHDARRWLLLLGGELLYNTLLALPLFLLLRRLGLGQTRDNPFGRLP